MLPTPAQVRQYIADGLPCEHLDVQGDGSHFDAVIVSTAFEGKRLIPVSYTHLDVYKRQRWPWARTSHKWGQHS